MRKQSINTFSNSLTILEVSGEISDTLHHSFTKMKIYKELLYNKCIRKKKKKKIIDINES